MHAGVAAKAQERSRLERLCRCISRPAVSEKRLSLTPSGNVRCELKTPYRDGTAHVIFEPLGFIARLAALVPKPRVNLTRLSRCVRTQQQAMKKRLQAQWVCWRKCGHRPRPSRLTEAQGQH